MMHTVTIGIESTMLTLQFKNFKEADHTFQRIQKAMDVVDFSVLVEDDYARKVMVRPSEIRLLMVTDMERTGEADIEVALATAKANAKLQSRASSDPVLRMAMNGAMAPSTRVLGRG